MWFKRERDALKEHLENSARRIFGPRNIYLALLLSFVVALGLGATTFFLTSQISLTSWLNKRNNERQEVLQEVLLSSLNDKFIRETEFPEKQGQDLGLNEVIQTAVFLKPCIIAIEEAEHMAFRDPIEGDLRTVIRETYRTTYTFGSLSYIEAVWEVRPELMFRRGRLYGVSDGALFVYMSAENTSSVRSEIVDSSRNDQMDSLGWIATFHVQTNLISVEKFVESWLMRERECGNGHEVEIRGIERAL